MNYSNFAIVASFFGLWINSFFSSDIQLFLGFILIFSFGILHGANDVALISNVNSTNKTLRFSQILTYYVVIVLTGAAMFYLVPWLALALFILVSGYHFGEQQWNEKLQIENEPIKLIFRMVYGLLVLFLLFTFHTSEVREVIYAITKTTIPLLYFSIAFKTIITLYVLLSLYLYFQMKSFKLYFISELFYLIVFAILFKASSLIWGFALYFILWHSIPSIIDQIKFLYGSASFKNFKSYFRTAFVYWIVSLAGITLLYLIFKEEKIFNALFFSFLASITFPHVLVVQKMFGKNK
jgi:Brp/Blh family beta-carotene 15,15'-monooxygenase